MALYYLCHEIYTPNVPIKSLNNMIFAYPPTLTLTTLHLTHVSVSCTKTHPFSFLVFTYASLSILDNQFPFFF